MSDEYPSRSLEKVVVRLPDGMRDRLRDAASENKRSMNAEIVARLEESFPRYSYDPNTPERLESLDQMIGRLTDEIREKLDTLDAVQHRAKLVEALLNGEKKADE